MLNPKPVAIAVSDQLPGTALVTGVKFAATVCALFICTMVGLAVVEPDQFTNRYPDAALAVKMAVPPASTHPAPVTVPASGGLITTDNWYCVLNDAVYVVDCAGATITRGLAVLPSCQPVITD